MREPALRFASVRRILLTVLLCGTVGGTLSPETSKAQGWRQTAKIVTPIEQGDPAKVLLDSLIQIGNRTGLKVYRSDQKSERYTISELQDQILEEQALAMSNANRMQIGYEFQIDSQGTFSQRITSISYFFRPPGGQSDVQIMYLDASREEVQDILRNKGIAPENNLNAVIPFSQQLGFARLARSESAQVSEIAGRIFREDKERRQQKRELIQTIQRLVYSQ